MAQDAGDAQHPGSAPVKVSFKKEKERFIMDQYYIQENKKLLALASTRSHDHECFMGKYSWDQIAMMTRLNKAGIIGSHA
jgi:hypothetical protein